MGGEPYQVACAPCAEYDPAVCRAALEEVIGALDGFSWLKPGMRVGIKANLVSFLKPEAAATTHPELLIALTHLLTERGAEVIVGDSPGGLYTEAYVGHVYRMTGMHRVEAAGARLNHNYGQKTAQFSDAVQAKEFQYTAWLDDCDAVINFCKLKSHGMMAMSAGAKNLFGIIPGTRKPEYHFQYSEPKAFADMLVDLNEFCKTKLTICDAVIGMEGNGPTSGTPRAIGCVIASPSAHHLDLLCAHLIGLKPGDVPTLQAAHLRGLVPAAVSELNIYGDYDRFRMEDFETVAVPSSLLFRNTFDGGMGKLFGNFVAACMCARPALKGNGCTGCGQCMRICPAKAIHMEKKRPVIDRKACIRCFCCQEFCPQGALQVHRPIIARILNR